MTAELANVDANLEQAERLTRLAFEHGARWVILPEFFASGLAFHPNMAKAVRVLVGAPAQLLRQLARKGQAYVGGSLLAWQDGNAYNSFLRHFRMEPLSGTTRTTRHFGKTAITWAAAMTGLIDAGRASGCRTMLRVLPIRNGGAVKGEGWHCRR
jgi:hypothetical protein